MNKIKISILTIGLLTGVVWAADVVPNEAAWPAGKRLLNTEFSRGITTNIVVLGATTNALTFSFTNGTLRAIN